MLTTSLGQTLHENRRRPWPATRAAKQPPRKPPRVATGAADHPEDPPGRWRVLLVKLYGAIHAVFRCRLPVTQALQDRQAQQELLKRLSLSGWEWAMSRYDPHDALYWRCHAQMDYEAALMSARALNARQR